MARQQLLMDWRTSLNTLNMMKIVVALAPATTADFKVTFVMLALPFGSWYSVYVVSTCYLMLSGLSSHYAALDWVFVATRSLAKSLCVQAMRKMRDAVKSKMAQALSDFRNMQQLEDALEQAQVCKQHICNLWLCLSADQ